MNARTKKTVMPASNPVAVETARSRKLKSLRDAWFLAGARCYYCGSETMFGSDITKHPSVDHLIPITKGGSDLDDNLVFSCRGCNYTKSNKTLEDAKLPLRLKLIGWPKFNQEQVSWLRRRGFDLSELDAARLHFEKSV